MEQKKETRGQLERRIKNSLVFIPKDKEYSGVYFSDRGLRLEVTSEYCVISTMFHRHIFDRYNTATTLSRPYLYTQRTVEIALENDCKTEQGYSYNKLLEVLKAKEDQAEYNIATYVDWWLYLIFNNLYSIAEDEASSWIVYFKYIQSIAMNAIILDEHKEDATNKQFVERFKKMIDEFTENIEERVLFRKKTDAEVMQENIEATQEQIQQEAMEAQVDGSQD